MAITRLSIEEFIEQAKQHPVFDVRSNGEFNHAQIPGAYSLPLFTDEERKIVGTSYKREGKQSAIKLGLEFFGVKMKAMTEQAETIIKNHYARHADAKAGCRLESQDTILIHCWRGGMRSAAVAWLLDLYGFNVYLLTGGYKAYRNWVLQQFEKDYEFIIIGGYTGSGKTGLVEELQRTGRPVINLEGIANHRGSAFGDMGDQPTQEMFENILAEELHRHSATGHTIWLEDESQRVGQLNIPNDLWKTMRASPLYFIEIPFEERLDHIISMYGSIKKEILINSITRIQKRLGPLETKTAIAFLTENNHKSCFTILLNYYDKLYNKSLRKREDPDSLLNKISCLFVNTISNTEKLLACATVNI